MFCLFFKIGYKEGLQQQASSYTSSSNISVFFRLVQHEQIQGRPRATLRPETHQAALPGLLRASLSAQALQSLATAAWI